MPQLKLVIKKLGCKSRARSRASWWSHILRDRTRAQVFSLFSRYSHQHHTASQRITHIKMSYINIKTLIKTKPKPILNSKKLNKNTNFKCHTAKCFHLNEIWINMITYHCNCNVVFNIRIRLVNFHCRSSLITY